MTRLELLQLLVARARAQGFEFRRWYTTRLGLPWISTEAAVRLLEQQRRYYALIFSHEFASTFWKPGAELTFEMPAQSFERIMPDGSTRTVQRKPFIRRSARPEAWRYHLRQMALADEPLRYLRKYLPIQEQLDLVEPTPASLSASGQASAAAASPLPVPMVAPRRSVAPGALPRPLPMEAPAFLNRPYPRQARDEACPGPTGKS